MTVDINNPNFPGLDTNIAAGQRVTTRTSRFAYNASAGAIIAAIIDPFGSGSTFATVGTVPGQLALSGGNIVKGASAAQAGTTYKMRVLATSADGLRDTSSILSFVAVDPAPVVVTPTPTPTPTPSPSLSLSSAVTQVEGNSGTSAFVWTLTLNRDGSTASYPYSWAVTGSGTNPADAADFGGTFPSGSGTFAPGETSKTITVLVTGDTANEPNETFTLTVTAAGLNTVTSTGTISNDDTAGGALNYPRIAVVGPSTDANNMYGTNSPTPARNGPAASGPLVWALAKDRRARMLTFTPATSPYWDGDIKAVGGAVLSGLQTQIDAAINRKNLNPNDAWIAAYNPGRNDLQDGKLLADYQAAVPGHIMSMRNAGFSYIMLALLAYKPAAYGGGWVADGAYRQEVDKINAWLVATYGSAADIKIIDMQTALIDPASGAAKEPYANSHRSDYTHLTNQGGERAAAPYVSALQAIAVARPYPTDTVSIAPFSGTGGTLTGPGLTGTMADGWTAALEAAGPTIVASQVVENGRTWQRFTVSNTAGIASTGVNLRITRNAPVAIPAGVRRGMRTLFRSTASSVKHSLFFTLGNASGQGDTSVPAARAALIAGIADPTAQAAIGGAGANFSGAPGFLPVDKTVLFEASSFAQGASGGSNANIDLLIIIGPGNAGDSIVFDLADPQDFNFA